MIGRGCRRLGCWLGAIVVGAAGLVVSPASGQGDAGDPGPYQAGRSRVTVTRPDSQTFSTLLYYPATATGNDTPYDPSGAPYPAVSFGHGFLTQPTAYDSTLRHLATHGYFVLATESYTGFFPDHSKYADDLLHCLTWLEQQNADAGSPYFGGVRIGAFGLSGHSMGGGASVLATARDARVRALANLAAAETNPSAIAAMRTIRAPVALLSGSEDGITPPGQHQVPMYEAGSAPKQLPSLLGGFHCGFLDGSIPFCDSGSMSRADQLEITRRLLVEFFDLYLKGEQGRWRAVWGPGAADDPRVSVTMESGIRLSPEWSSLAVRAGARATRSFTITNEGPLEQSCTVTIEESPWPATADPGETPSLPPGHAAEVDITVAPPSDAAGQRAEALVTARSDRDGGTRGYGRLTIEVFCPSDWNLDGRVNTLDITAFLNDWTGSDPEADFNGDGVADTRDVLAFLNSFASGC